MSGWHSEGQELFQRPHVIRQPFGHHRRAWNPLFGRPVAVGGSRGIDPLLERVVGQAEVIVVLGRKRDFLTKGTHSAAFSPVFKVTWWRDVGCCFFWRLSVRG